MTGTLEQLIFRPTVNCVEYISVSWQNRISLFIYLSASQPLPLEPPLKYEKARKTEGSVSRRKRKKRILKQWVSMWLILKVTCTTIAEPIAYSFSMAASSFPSFI
jgi:hypothetical protein